MGVCSLQMNEQTPDGDTPGARAGALLELAAAVESAAAELLASGNFSLIRRCESESCVLWFYDRTKSHQRRWCSMASCGNRHKVAAFRKRRSEA